MNASNQQEISTMELNDIRVYDPRDDVINCHFCDCEILWEDKISRDGKMICYWCDYDTDLLNQYSEEQQNDLINYANKHNLTIEESIDYQTHCHCCGKEENDGVFGESHQYCKKRCQEHCEDYRYLCYRRAECKVCDIWAYHVRRDSLTAYDIHISECEPVLSAIDAFKELKVYNQFYGCLGDLTEYFGDLAFYDDDDHPDLYY